MEGAPLALVPGMKPGGTSMRAASAGSSNSATSRHVFRLRSQGTRMTPAY
jgi:hypothetical protein